MVPGYWRLVVPLIIALADGTLAQEGDGRDDVWAQARAEFQLALESARASAPQTAPDSRQLRDYPLYRYLQAERIVGALSGAQGETTPADEAAARFLERHDNTPVAWPVRYAWSSSLARRERWEDFLREYRPSVTDAELRCRYFHARIRLEDLSGLVPLVIDEWLTPAQLPAECEPVFQWLRDEGSLTDDLIAQRARLLLENGQTGFARVIMRRLPERRAEALARWADLLERPAEAIDDFIADPSVAVESEALQAGWARLARDDPEAALDRYADLVAASRDDPAAAEQHALDLALGLAWDRRPEALQFFDLAGDALDDYALEWRARAALWAGAWPTVDDSIAAMSAAQRSTSRWRYWAARAAAVRGDEARATELYESLAADDNYYSAMAGAYLRRRVRPHELALTLHRPTVDALARNPALVRARELQRVGLPVASLREWREAYARLDADGQRQTIHLAAEWEWYDLAVATATRFEVFNDYGLLYPRPYAAQVRAAARETDVDEQLLYAVMRQESLFRADAVSAAGARGLMQLRPGTAEPLVRELELPTGAGESLLDPDINVRIGAAELDRLLQRYGGQWVVALAAYNAGPYAADRWLPGAGALDADIWLENIPYNETREYVRRVLWNLIVFRWLETGRSQSTRSCVATIAGPGG
jgi:soluble lytic murein transglycosylase